MTRTRTEFELVYDNTNTNTCLDTALLLATRLLLSYVAILDSSSKLLLSCCNYCYPCSGLVS